MLVIARRVGETVRIGPDIAITIREIQGRRVRLSVTAPASVAITRAELEREDEEPRASHGGACGDGGGEGRCDESES